MTVRQRNDPDDTSPLASGSRQGRGLFGTNVSELLMGEMEGIIFGGTFFIPSGI